MTFVDPYGLWRESLNNWHNQSKEFSNGFSRGAIDDTFFGTSNYLLGEQSASTFISDAGYYTGTGCSMAVGMVYGGTWMKAGGKAVQYGGKVAINAYKCIRNLFTATKSTKAATVTKNVAKLAQESTPLLQRISHTDEMSSITKQSVSLSRGAESVNATNSLNSKLSGLQKAQSKAAKSRILPDGRIRYYGIECSSHKIGRTRGASYVTEWTPKNGNLRSWIESYDYFGRVNRVHPKMINEQTVNSWHFPPTAKELGI
jgi:hypothetical protein